MLNSNFKNRGGRILEGEGDAICLCCICCALIWAACVKCCECLEECTREEKRRRRYDDYRLDRLRILPKADEQKSLA